MGLNELNLKLSYDSDVDDILNSFYIPVLSNSIIYKRIVGFFSSSSLAIAAKGIANFILNNGQMQLLCGVHLTKSDIEEIKKAYKNPQEIIENSMLNELENLEEEIIKDHVGALGWMIANGKLEIKIAILLDKNGLPLTKGMLHQKIGILEDSQGNMISFSGSNNETAFAWKANIEEFKVFRNWIKHEKEYFNSDLLKFEKYWEGQTHRMDIIDIPVAVKNKLVKMAPNDIMSIISSEISNEKSKKQKKVKLWDYQNEAINNWIKNGKNGIFEMATGTGKTFTALGCLNKELKESKKLLCVITAPYQHLVQQWKNSIEKFGIEYDDLIIADSTNSFWKDKLADLIIDISLGHENKAIVIATHRTFSSEDFKEIINYKDKFNIILIADEVHGLGAENSKLGLTDAYDFKLGLSATPKRWFDDYGTEIIYDYFGGVVYEFDLEKAIYTTNPATGNTYLTPYNYNPKFLSLKSKELEDYFEITRHIAVKYGSKKDKEEDTRIESLLFKRANIIKNAEEKYSILEEILDEIGSNLKWTIIYCTEHQIKKVMEIIKKRRISAHLFTMNEGTKPDNKLNGLSERDYILKKFIEGYYKVLIAIKCLDEGVDIPPARIAIMMASSGNPREHIQRLGRIIRRYPDKNKALVYDLFVLPDLNKFPSEFRDLERKIFDKEFERYEEIASISINNAEALEIIYDAKYRLGG